MSQNQDMKKFEPDKQIRTESDVYENGMPFHRY